MKCPKCGSENTRIELVNEVQLKRKRNWIYWIFGLWMFDFLIWLSFFLPRLIIQLLKGKKYKTVNIQKKVFICSSCGHSENL